MQIKFIIKISISLLRCRTLDKVKHNRPTLHFNIDNYILYDYSHLEHNIFSRFVISQICTFVFNDSQNLQVVGVLWMENGFWKRQLKVGETIERLFIFTVLVDPKTQTFSSSVNHGGQYWWCMCARICAFGNELSRQHNQQTMHQPSG